MQTNQFLTDGGIYENLGIRAISTWAEAKEGEEVLVSDAERPFGWVLQEWSRFRLVLPRATRASDILMRRVSEFERAQSKDWIYIRLQDSALGFTETIQDLVRKTRTDLDRFTRLEIQCLVYQGYAAAHHILGGDFSPHLEIRDDCPQVKTESKEDGWLPFASVKGSPADDLEKSQRMSVFGNIFTPGLFSPFALLVILVLGLVGTVWLDYQRRARVMPTGLSFRIEKLDETLSREGTEGPTKDVFQALGAGLDNPQHFRAETPPLGSYTENRPCERFLCRISNTNSTLRIVFYFFRMKKTEKGEIWEYLDKADLNKAETGDFTVPASDPDHYLVLLGFADLFGEPNRKKIDSSLKVEVGHAR